MIVIRKKIKIIIFTLLFIIIAPLIVFYANGYIFSNGWSLIKTGGIYVRSAPIGSEVYLNNSLVNKITFFNRDILIKNLTAGSYRIKVNKDGYNQWFKKISVSNNLVSDANVFMLSEKVETRIIPKYATSTSDVATGSKKVKNQEYTETLSLFIATTTKISKISSTTLIDFKNNLGTEKSPIMNSRLGLWREGGKIFVKWFGSNETAPKYLCDASMNCLASKLVFELPKEPSNISFLPGYDGVIVVSTENLVFAVQIEDNPDKMIQILYNGKSPDFRLDSGLIYVKDGDTLAEILL
jgi:hypothetical protein